MMQEIFRPRALGQPPLPWSHSFLRVCTDAPHAFTRQPPVSAALVYIRLTAHISLPPLPGYNK